MKKTIILSYYIVLLMLFVMANSAFAVDQPDAGRTLQELNAQPTPSVTSPDVSIESAASATPAEGGTKVTIRSIELSGNSAFSDKKLRKLLAGVEGREFNLAGLNALAARLTDYYHRHNYPFARAILPAQSIQDGNLKIDIIEGRYGDITIVNDAPHKKAAEGFLYTLHSGDTIEGKELERISLLLNDQPGYEFVPIVRPGQEVGTGDLVLRMNQTKRFGGSIGADNYGNRFTGQWRGLIDVYVNSLLGFGDQFKISGVGTEENMWVGSAGYSTPVGHAGLRAQVGFSRVQYELGKQFNTLDAHGMAEILSGGLSYPIIRSQKTNLSVSILYQHKWLQDDEDSTDSTDKKSSDSLPVSLNFDQRDNFLGGGLNYGTFSWTHGLLDLEEDLAVTDSTTAHSDGEFDKFNLDLARIQSLPLKNTTFFARVSGQRAVNNLDSSEDFGLGGPYGVRAYPTGEGYGDEGVFAQSELRYNIGYFTPYGFYDHGELRINHHPWAVGNNHRRLAGGGVGLRANYKDVSADCSVAWRSLGNDPQSDDKDKTPMVWFNVKVKF